MYSTINIIHSTIQLGRLIRTERKASGITLQQSSKNSNIGVRFLSELERGKATAEIGKVITAVHAVGLDLAVVQQDSIYPDYADGESDPNNSELAHSSNDSIHETSHDYQSRTLSESLELEFPYDWSNPDMSNTQFIRLVLAKARFNDILRIAYHFGIDHIEQQLGYFNDLPQFDVLTKLISRIQAGIEAANAQDTL